MKGGAFFADRSIYLETVAYLGVIAIVLAALAVAVRRRNAAVIAFAAMTVFMFCLVFVPPVVSAAYQLPLVGTFLWNRALIPMAFGVAVLAGMGTDLLAQRHSERKVRQWFGYGFVGVTVVLGALWLFGRGHLPAAEAEIRAHSFLWPVAATVSGLVLADSAMDYYSRSPFSATFAGPRRTWRCGRPHRCGDDVPRLGRRPDLVVDLAVLADDPCRGGIDRGRRLLRRGLRELRLHQPPDARDKREPQCRLLPTASSVFTTR